MTRNEFFAAIASQTKLDEAQVQTVFDAAYHVIVDKLSDSGKVSLGALGQMKLLKKRARMGRHPKTGQPLRIAEKSVVKFAVSKPISDAFLDKKKKR